MKIFIYKSLIVSLLIIIIFKVTVSSTIKNYEKKIYESFNKEKIEFIKEKIRFELKSAIKKENYLNKEDAILIKKFLIKINNEIYD